MRNPIARNPLLSKSAAHQDKRRKRAKLGVDDFLDDVGSEVARIRARRSCAEALQGFEITDEAGGHCLIPTSLLTRWTTENMLVGLDEIIEHLSLYCTPAGVVRIEAESQMKVDCEAEIFGGDIKVSSATASAEVLASEKFKSPPPAAAQFLNLYYS